MEIIVDTREPKEVFDAIIFSAAHVEEKTKTSIKCSNIKLDTGDFCVMKGGVPLVYIERKTWSDLAASIKDERCENQWDRLSLLIKDGFQIHWIIEGKIPNLTGNDYGMKNVCLHGMINSMVSKGYSIIHTKNIDHTAHTITGIAKHKLNDIVYENITSRFINNIKLPDLLNPDLKEKLLILFNEYGGGCDAILEPSSFNPMPTVIKMWKCFLGNSKIIMNIMKIYSVREVINDINIIDALRYDNGRKIPKRETIKEKIADDKILIDIISCVNGVSEELGKFIYSELGSSLRDLKEPKRIEKNGRAINKNILPRYIECLDYKNI